MIIPSKFFFICPMLTIKSFTFNPVQENTYLLHDETKECLIIDPGCWNYNEQQQLKSYLEQNQLKPVRFICTHCHFDHTWGALWVYETYGLKPEFHPNEQSVYDDTPARSMMFGFDQIKLPPRGEYLDLGKDITFGNTRLEMRFVPGHSPGSVLFYHVESKQAIVGDVIFQGSMGRTDLPGGSYPVLMKSIFEQVLTLPAETKLYSGHGNMTTVAAEARNNPYVLEEKRKGIHSLKH